MRNYQPKPEIELGEFELSKMAKHPFKGNFTLSEFKKELDMSGLLTPQSLLSLIEQLNLDEAEWLKKRKLRISEQGKLMSA